MRLSAIWRWTVLNEKFPDELADWTEFSRQICREFDCDELGVLSESCAAIQEDVSSIVLLFLLNFLTSNLIRLAADH